MLQWRAKGQLDGPVEFLSGPDFWPLPVWVTVVQPLFAMAPMIHPSMFTAPTYTVWARPSIVSGESF